MIQRLGPVWLCCLFALALCVGCWKSTPPVPKGNESGPNEVAALPSGAGTAAAEKPKETLEPFDAPKLEDLDAKAKWEDQPIKDDMELLREHLSKQDPLATVDEALKLENKSNSANEKILSALGRPPKNEGEVNYEATFNRRLNGDINSPNPVLFSAAVDADVHKLITVWLFNFDWTLTAFGSADYLKSWQSSEDRMYDKIVLRDDLTWSDGKPVTAYDVEFSFQTIMNPDVPAVAVRSGTEKLRWVKAYNDRTVVFFHRESLATNQWNILFPIIPKHIYEESVKEDPTLTTSEYHVKQEYNPVVGGPYKVTRRTRDQEILLTRRDDWYMHDGKQVRQKPYFKEVRFRIIKDSNTALLALKGSQDSSGNLDEMELTPQQWTTQTSGDDFKNNTKARGVQWIYFYFGWNNDPVKAPFFTDKRVRQAMSYAFDHDEMLEKLWYGLYEACNGIYHPTAWMYPKDAKPPYKQDLDKAQDLLEEAGWEDHDGDGVLDKEINGRSVPFEFTIQCGESPESIAVCELLKTNLDQIGIICHIKPTEWTVMQDDNQKHNFQAYFAGWGTGTDPDMSENLWGTGKDRNYVQYSNPKIDQLFEQGRKTFDRQERAKIYGQIHNILYQDQPYTWLYFRSSFYGFNKKLRGYMFSPRGPYHFDPGVESIYQVSE